MNINPDITSRLYIEHVDREKVKQTDIEPELPNVEIDRNEISKEISKILEDPNLSIDDKIKYLNRIKDDLLQAEGVLVEKAIKLSGSGDSTAVYNELGVLGNEQKLLGELRTFTQHLISELDKKKQTGLYL